MIARRIVFSSTVGWSMFVIFLISLGLLSVGIPKIVMSFKQTGEYQVETNYSPTGKKVFLKVNEVGLDDYHGVTLQLRGHNEKNFRLTQNFKSQGTTKAQAIENAKMIEYHVFLKDSVLTFDSNIIFKPGAVFRAQELNMILYVPYNAPFVLDRSSSIFIDNYIEHGWLDDNTWVMTEKGLECLTCPKEETTSEDSGLTDFDQLDIHGIVDVRIHQGDNYSVELTGPEEEKKKYQIYRSGKTLVIDFEGKRNFNLDWKTDKVLDDQVHISITMPDLERLEANGTGSIEMEEFQVDDLELELRGPIKMEGDLQTEEIMINLTGAAELFLKGHSQRMNADLTFASSLKAYDFEVDEARVEVNGASKAKLNVTGKLEIEEGMASDIDYRGNPEIIRHSN
jgi:hypothetical protein